MIIEIIVITLIGIIPLYAVLIWTYFNPEDSILFGNRWKYKEEPEPSDLAVRYVKGASLFSLIALTVILGLFILGHT
ncbi:hypothetical protein DNH61_24355 [Paenibacillus sambharensis]|uniref:DUF6199 domain-containing protein n=1 Tax=Paenibacillus sambharensis TaxID=1803190 RepID=A0A2W1LDP6_9BACL|nr:hypothetical protein [Paenibacillus sambharensis]PZD93182.1 hypothetical protein DNH61_24355 [Paenibacillus sambharensis]